MVSLLSLYNRNKTNNVSPACEIHMKILKTVLVVVGVVLIGFGLYNAFVPKEVLDIGPLEVSAKEGLNNQSLAMIGLGVLALVAGAFMRKR